MKQIKRIKLAIYVGLILVGIVVINYNQDEKHLSFSLENIEALAHSENNFSHPDCVQGKGFCIINGVKLTKIPIFLKK